MLHIDSETQILPFVLGVYNAFAALTILPSRSLDTKHLPIAQQLVIITTKRKLSRGTSENRLAGRSSIYVRRRTWSGVAIEVS